ncbi:2,3-diaminopropionate biosynthesis protein SbnB [Ferviditalea candida]|uniref:2,3-diaminopropionate biosynthesis protein SbnB n=1 Tax=Ferviditalea candida TaxID=3108399 RepID=A0ABU5ZGJ4_9BACL|nr:2,3-diaminopropionate biosynthesis protein SbnB [Paenibacillaceae bacterium T2]
MDLRTDRQIELERMELVLLYLNEQDIGRLGADWNTLIKLLEDALFSIDAGDYAQPLKPYLRYKDLRNRIIAMPAYVGGSMDVAGIKWVSSFPGNVDQNLPRAHNVVILNDAATGKPEAIIHSPLLNILRTAAVSGLLLKHWLQARPGKRLKVGIIGWGPIGRRHFRMCTELFGDRIDRIFLYDLRAIDPETAVSPLGAPVTVTDNWEEAYEEADVFITCTVSDYRYVNVPPKNGRLLMDISLRDFQLDALTGIGTFIVDDWEEVCRENTDIELLHLAGRLSREQALSLTDVVCRKALLDVDGGESVFFSPMGMAVFDISVADYYRRLAQETGAGQLLE